MSSLAAAPSARRIKVWGTARVVENDMELAKACQLIQSDGAAVSEVAWKVGYNSASQFGREYNRYFGGTPNDRPQK